MGILRKPNTFVVTHHHFLDFETDGMRQVILEMHPEISPVLCKMLFGHVTILLLHC